MFVGVIGKGWQRLRWVPRKVWWVVFWRMYIFGWFLYTLCIDYHQYDLFPRAIVLILTWSNLVLRSCESLLMSFQVE